MLVSASGGCKFQQEEYFLISMHTVRGTDYLSIDVKLYDSIIGLCIIICVLHSVSPHF